MKKLTASQKLEKELAGIRESLNELLTNHIPHLKTRLGNVESRGAFHTTLILGIYAAVFAAALAIFVTVLVK